MAFPKIANPGTMRRGQSPALLLLFSFALSCSAQPDTLRKQIEQLVHAHEATVGVGLYALESADSLTVGEQRHYPMQSVYKFHVALAVLHLVDAGTFTLDQPIHVTKKDLRPHTWSPLREKYPRGDVDLPLREILVATIAQSDNNGCDRLFRLVGGTETVNRYIHGLGYTAVEIKATEAEMHRTDNAQFSNWTTPFTTAQLLAAFYRQEILSDASTDFLRETMERTATGPKRLKGLLPAGTIVAHKTGTSGTNKKGIASATNDVGIITLPNGQHIAIAVFVANSPESGEANEKIIADIAKLVWAYYGGK